jgi:hypothetical protein
VLTLQRLLILSSDTHFLHERPVFRLNHISLKFIDKPHPIWFFKSAFRQSHQNSHASRRTHYIYGLVRYIEIIIYHRRGGGLYVPKTEIMLTPSEAEQNACVIINQSEVSVAADLGMTIRRTGDELLT